MIFDLFAIGMIIVIGFTFSLGMLWLPFHKKIKRLESELNKEISQYLKANKIKRD